MSYSDKRRSKAECGWPSCDGAGIVLTLDPNGRPDWFCPTHAEVVKGMK